MEYSKLYPGLTESEAMDVANGKVSYKDAISKKMAKQNIDNKEAAKNSLLYEYLSSGDASLKVMYDKANRDDEIINEGRRKIKEMGLNNTDYTDQELIDMYKEKHGNDAYIKTLNGDNSFLDGSADTLRGIGTIGGTIGGIYGARKAIQGIKGSIPTTGKYRDVYKYIANNILNQKTSIAPEYVDKKIMNVVDYLSNLSDGSYKSIKGNKIGQIRGLYNQLRSDLSNTYNEASKIKQANSDIKFGSEILDPLNKEIDRLKSVGDISDKYKSLVEIKNEVEGLLKKNKGFLNLNDVDLLKEIAYENYDFTKQAQVAADAKAIKKGYANKLLGQGIKQAQDYAIPELKPRNESYGKVKDILKSVGLETNKLSKMEPYTKIGELRSKFGQTIGGVPGISAASNLIEGDLPLKKIEEAKLADIISTTKKFAPKIKDFIVKYGSKEGLKDIAAQGVKSLAKGVDMGIVPEDIFTKRTIKDINGKQSLVKGEKIPSISEQAISEISKVSQPLTPAQKEEITKKTSLGQSQTTAGAVAKTPQLSKTNVPTKQEPSLITKGINYIKSLFD